MSQTAQSWWFVFYKDELLLEKKENGTFALPYGEIPPVFMIEKTTVHDVTTLEGSNCKAFSLARPIEESAKYVLVGLRASYECLPVAHYQAAGKAHEILHWDRNSRFCSACGTPMEQKESIMKKCPNCGREVYPAISTAILVLVRKGDSILLVHARNFKGRFNSLVAGFLETGETLEECVAREVKEETGLDKLEDAIKELFFSGNLELNEDIYIANQRQKQLLIEAKEAFLLVKDGIESGMSEDFLTIDLMTAYEKLGYIIGEEVEDDLADKIFKSFCMGK